MQATGALPPNLAVVPLATETVFEHKTHWLATRRFEQLVIFAEDHGRVAISDILTEAQRIERRMRLQALRARPKRRGLPKDS